MNKIGILLTHPVQYCSPLFGELAKKVDLTVYYCYKPNKKKQGFGFGVEFAWDTPLLKGYGYKFLKTPDEITKEIQNNFFDLFIVFGWYYRESRLALSVCRKCGIPIYVRGDSQLLTQLLWKWKKYAKQIFFRKFLAKFNGFLSVGQRFSEYLKFYKVPEKKIIFCPHHIDNDFFKANMVNSVEKRKRLRKQYGIDEGKTIFLFCGKFMAEKRPLDFLRALKIIKGQNKDVEGLLVGDGRLKKKLKRYLIIHKLNVSFLGFLNQTEMPKIYSIADCLVLPSARETWGLVINEAFACGIPAIVSDKVGCVPDLIKEGVTGYSYKCGNIEELVLKMKQFIKDKELSRDFNRALCEKVKKYSVKNAADAIISLFH